MKLNWPETERNYCKYAYSGVCAEIKRAAVKTFVCYVPVGLCDVTASYLASVLLLGAVSGRKDLR